MFEGNEKWKQQLAEFDWDKAVEESKKIDESSIGELEGPVDFNTWFETLTEDEKYQVEEMKQTVMRNEADVCAGDACDIVYALWNTGFRKVNLAKIIEAAQKAILKKVLKVVSKNTDYGMATSMLDLAKAFPRLLESRTQTVRTREYNDYTDEYEDREYTRFPVRVKGTKKWYGGMEE